MDSFTKQMLIVGVVLLLGGLFIVSGLRANLHNAFAESLEPVISKYTGPYAATAAQTLAYGLQLLFGAVLIISPISLFGGIWYFAIGFDLIWGMNADVNVFIFFPFLNDLFGALCMFVFVYSIYLQWEWAKKFAAPLPYKTDDKDLARLI